VARSTLEALDLLVSRASKGLTLISDDHPAYRTAVARHPASRTILHRVYPDPPRETATDRELARERDRQMGPADTFHKLWRHSQAHHRRETIAFGRRSNAVLERAAAARAHASTVELARCIRETAVSGADPRARKLDSNLPTRVNHPGRGSKRTPRPPACLLGTSTFAN
jgi:hypothetical protein